jgi:hypothetical protein
MAGTGFGGSEPSLAARKLFRRNSAIMGLVQFGRAA